MIDPIGWSVRHWQLTSLLLALCAALGLQAWLGVPRSEDPPFSAPTFLVIAVLPGSPPEEVETLVARPLEDHVRSLDALDRLRVAVEDGVAELTVEFEVSEDADERHAALLRELDAARPGLPAELQRLEVRPLRPTEVNVLQYAIVSDAAPLSALRAVAERVEDAAESVRGVRDAAVAALPDERIDVAVDPDALAALNLSPGAVVRALEADQARVPGGYVEEDGRRLLVTPATPWPDADAIAAAPLPGGVRLRDVARVERRHEEPQHLARLDGHRAVWVGVAFEEGASVFRTRDAVDEVVRSVALPDGVRIELAFDQSANVARRLSGFARDFAVALALVLVTLAPLGLRAGAIVAASIPLSLAGGLALLWWSGYTVNQLSIVGFVISLGLLVDDAIVVVENTSRHLRRGASPEVAAVHGAREIALAVAGCTATLLLAFLPLLFLPGMPGVFIRSLPLAVVFTVASSLGVSIGFVPLLASRALRPEGEHGNRVLRAVDVIVARSYGRLLDRALARPLATLGLAAIAVVGSLALLPIVGFSLFPKADLPQFRVEVDAGDGAALAVTDRAVRAVEEELRRHPEVVGVLANVGAGNPRIYYNVRPAARRASVGELVVRTARVADPALLDALQATFDHIPGARVRVREFENGPPIDAPVAIRLVGEELDSLRAASAAVAEALRGIPGLASVHDPLAVPRLDLRVDVDRDAAAELGVPVAEIARTVRFGLAGLRIGALRDEVGRELPVIVRGRGEGEPDRARLRGLTVASAAGGVLPLADVSTVRLVSGPARITRQDGRRVATVTAEVARGRNTAERAGRAARAVTELHLPRGIRWELAGEAESRRDSFGGVGAAALVAAAGILGVLVAEFRTFRATGVVATVVPLGVAGGIVALFVTGHTLSFTASIGFVALIGIEIKASLLLVDFANQLRRDGLPLEVAVRRAAETRFLPILLTTATALGGLLPLAAEGSALYSPLAWVLIGGLIASTALARLVTPAAYKVLAPPV